VVRCQLGETDALDDLVAAWHQRLRRYVRTLLPSDEMAGEAVQNIWLRILRGLPALREPHLFPGWAYRIAYRAAMDQLRVKYADALNDPLDPLTDEVGGGANTELEFERQIDAERLHAALTELPVLERNVLSLFYLQELSLVEISGVVDAPVGTVKSRLFRARRLLREVMNHG
jgi:RNA polymerase sigma factor (sigma-70 family)